ncbi:MAG: UbiA family prenyltransferase, partial [Candidatus Hodarchaeales archaeon]
SPGEFELYFFSFLPTVKCTQINYNQHCELQISESLEKGIKGIQITGRAEFIKDQDEIEKKIKPKINDASNSAFADYYNLPVARWIRIKPTRIKFIDFYQENQFEFIEYRNNQLGFFSNLKSSIKNRSKLWFRAVRAPFLIAAIIPILLGAALAFSIEGLFNFEWFFITMISGICIQGGANMINDYFDHTSRNDENNKNATPFNGGSRLIQSKLMSSTKVGIAAIILFTIGSIGALYLESVVGGYVILSLLILGIFLGIFYTGDPLRIGYKGFGEVAIFIGFGPIFVLVSWYIQTGSAEFLAPLYWSIPIGFLIFNILFINEFQDFEADQAVGKNTLVVLLGKKRSVTIYKTTTALTYIWIIAGAIIFLQFFALIAILTLPLAFKAFNHIDKHYDKIYELLPGNVMTIGIHHITGFLLAIGLILDGIIIQGIL